MFAGELSAVMTDNVPPKIFMVMATTTLLTFGSLVGSYHLLL